MPASLAYLGACEARERFLRRELRPGEWLDVLLDRASRLHRGRINATTAIFADQARQMAEESDRRYRSGTERPLEGIPVAVKEETSVAGWPRTIGSWLFDEVPARHHPLVDKLVAVGAIPHIQTTVPEFCVIGQTLSPRWGVTRNPWNPAITPGGSSGGSGAALAAGLAPLATGSDMAGSIRIPAALCGVYGYKPPFGRIAPTPGEELFAFAVEGPMARSLDDLILMQNAIAGPHPASYAAMPFDPLPEVFRNGDGLRVALTCWGRSSPLCPAIRSNLMTAAAALRSQGVQVDELELDWPLQEIADALIEAIFGIYLQEYLDHIDFSSGKPVSSYLRWLMDRHAGRHCSVQQAGALAARLHGELQDRVWSEGYRALLCPTLLSGDIAADLDLAAQRSVHVGGVELDSYLGWVATPPFNLLSRCPVLAVPTGFAPNRVPTSMQVVAAPYQDKDAFRIAWLHAQAAGVDPFRSARPAIEAVEGPGWT